MSVRRRPLLLALGAAAALLATGYRWGVPWAAARVADHLPAEVAATLADRALQSLDGQALLPSRLPEQWQFELQRSFARLIADEPGLANCRLLFRRAAPGAMPDAVPLPDGRVVLTDQLVESADSSGEVMAALAQALGHIQQRHGLRQLARSAPLAVLAAGYRKDAAGLRLAPGFPPALEAEADAVAVRLLRRNGYSAADLADLLEKSGTAGDNADRIERLRRGDAG